MTTLTAVEYLYQSWMFEDQDGYLDTEVLHLPITKKTPKRIFFTDMFGRPKSVDRQHLEQHGWAGVERGTGRYHVHANLADAEPAPRETPEAKVSRLRAEMAAAHPDRGGNADEFRAARARFERARASRPTKTEGATA